MPAPNRRCRSRLLRRTRRWSTPTEAPARTALVVEARDGFVHVFLPPVERLEKFLELVELVETVAQRGPTPVVLEGYGPPPDARIKTLMVTPDPGVIEVNLQPASSWAEWTELTVGCTRRPGSTAWGPRPSRSTDGTAGPAVAAT